MARLSLFVLLGALAVGAYLSLDPRRVDDASPDRPRADDDDDRAAPRAPPHDAHAAELAAIRALPPDAEAEALVRYEALLQQLDGARRSELSCELAVRLHNRAVHAAKNDDARGADADSARALALCPTHQELRKARAAMLTSFAAKEDRKTAEGRKRARELLERALEAAERADALALLGEVLYADDDLNGAVARYQRAVALAGEARFKERLEELEKKAAVEGTFSDRRHQHFVARFEGYAQEKLAWLALDILETAYFSIGRTLDLYPKEPFTVLIYTGDQYKRAVDVPDWSAGVFDGKIRIAEGQLALDKGHLEGILRHEYTHAALSTLPVRIPTWMNEGLAEHFEGSDADAARARVVRAKERGELIGWEELNGSFLSIADKERAGLAYATATALVGALIQARGSYALATFVTQLENGASFDEAFRSTYASTPEQHFARWQKDL